jgi:uncharacterized membrane protein
VMRFLKRFAQGELGLNRIEAFSDGIFAIVVTLLALTPLFFITPPHACPAGRSSSN